MKHFELDSAAHLPSIFNSRLAKDVLKASAKAYTKRYIYDNASIFGVIYWASNSE